MFLSCERQIFVVDLSGCGCFSFRESSLNSPASMNSVDIFPVVLGYEGAAYMAALFMVFK